MRPETPIGPAANDADAPPKVESPRRVIEPLFYGRRDLASAIAVSTATLARLESAGKIGPRPIRLGGRVLYEAAECCEWARSRGPDGELLDRASWQAFAEARRGRQR